MSFINLLASDTGFPNKAHTAEQGSKGEQRETGTPHKDMKKSCPAESALHFTFKAEPARASDRCGHLSLLQRCGHFLLMKSFTVPNVLSITYIRMYVIMY